MSWYVELAERGLVPDAAIRAAIRGRIGAKLRHERRGTIGERNARFRDLARELRSSPIAVEPDAANAQHYEVPTEFFELVLGPRMNYSSAYWPQGVSSLAEAEQAMLGLYATRARLADGQLVLDLGCGWGSFTLWAAERFPASRFVAVSNSKTQRAYIEDECMSRRLNNVEVVTADVNEFDDERRFDRVVSVEMLEHVRNHGWLFARIADLMAPDALFFVHVFSHRELAWRFEATARNDWIAQHFFSGGLMPSDDLLLHMQDDLALVDHWRLDGTHYQRTLRAWLDTLDEDPVAARAALDSAADASDADRELARWRIFLMTSEELWGYRHGREFVVSHYLYRRR